MINQALNPNNQIQSLDKLVETISESYNIVGERLTQLKEGIENAVVSYLKGELSKSNHNPSSHIILESIEDIDNPSNVQLIMESDSTMISLNDTPLCEIINSSKGIKCNLLEGINMDKINIDRFISCWNIDESKVPELIGMIKDSV